MREIKDLQSQIQHLQSEPETVRPAKSGRKRVQRTDSPPAAASYTGRLGDEVEQVLQLQEEIEDGRRSEGWSESEAEDWDRASSARGDTGKGRMSSR